jgi:formamidopyrimidine-DNA glycosylase
MPELPEVEAMRRGITQSVGSTIRSVRQTPSRYRPIRIDPSWEAVESGVVGRRIERVERIGKRVLIGLSGDWWLVIQPKMAGMLLAGDPPTPEHVRWQLDCQGASDCTITYWDRRGLGTLALWSDPELKERLGADAIGPDALGIDGERLRAIFGGLKRPIKPALMDQAKLAGVGNLYASEILFRCGISPRRRCHRIGKRAWDAIAASTRAILLDAINQGGSTLRDGTYLMVNGESGGYQEAHEVYGREGLPCPRCGMAVRRIVQAQRSTFYCPRCQVG